MHHSDRDMVRKSQEGHIFQHCWQYNPRKKILKKDVSIVLQVGSSVSPLSLLSVSAKIKFYKLTWGGKGREDCRSTSNMGRSNITFPKWSPQHGQRMLNPDVCTAGSKIFLQRARERTLSGLEMEQCSRHRHTAESGLQRGLSTLSTTAWGRAGLHSHGAFPDLSAWARKTALSWEAFCSRGPSSHSATYIWGKEPGGSSEQQ